MRGSILRLYEKEVMNNWGPSRQGMCAVEGSASEVDDDDDDEDNEDDDDDKMGSPITAFHLTRPRLGSEGEERRSVWQNSTVM